MKVVFITYGGGNLKYYNAVNRLVKEMKNFYTFDKILTYTDLELQKTDYYIQHKDFIKSNRRGNGYWIWKPYYVYNELQKLNDDDILLYLDCGFEINNQIMASAFLLKKCDRVMNFVREWLEICQEYKFINDEVSDSDNFQEFIEHRHDQSVFSLLAKKYNLNCIFDETWPDTMVDKDSPMRAMRKYN